MAKPQTAFILTVEVLDAGDVGTRVHTVGRPDNDQLSSLLGAGLAAILDLAEQFGEEFEERMWARVVTAPCPEGRIVQAEEAPT